MSTFICEYCDSEFSSRTSLINHMKKAKYCLKIQNKPIPEIVEKEKFKCGACNKYSSNKSNLISHLKKCYENLYKINEYILEKNKEIENLEKKIQFLKDQNIDFDKKNYALTEVNKLLDTDRQCVHDIAKQPKITNKTVNLLTSMNFSNKDEIKDLIENKYNLDYIFSGQKGCAKFAFDNIIKDENGNLKYICSDVGRSIYKYKDEDGVIQKDVDAKKLTRLLVDGGLKHKVSDLASKFMITEDGEINTLRFDTLLEKTRSISNIENDNNEFRKELTSMIV
jgi:predicted RNase H-like nuclease (RuvC/YqgF family)